MQGFVVQDWVLLRGGTTTNVVQEAKDWTAFSSFQDIVFWLEVRRLTPPAGNPLEWWFQTSPTKDEALFTTMAIKALSSPTLSPTFEPSSVQVPVYASAAVPLATWVRWVLHPTAASAWDVSFRVIAAANRTASPMRA